MLVSNLVRAPLRRHNLIWMALAVAVLLSLSCYSQSLVSRYERRASAYTANQPKWAGPVFTSNPLLVQFYREDFQRQITPAGARVWNIGVSRGLQFVPLPHLEFTVAPPPYFVRGAQGADGFGDLTLAVKYRIAAASEAHGNYVATALLSAVVPAGSKGNQSTDAVLTPQLLGGKGWGRFNVITSLAGTLPTGNTQTTGRTVVGNVVAEYHLFRFAWPQLESNTTAWFGGTRDRHAQSFLTPAVVFGRLPYTPNEKDRRRGFTVGAALQTAITRDHTYNHNLVFMTRFHF